MIANSLLAAGSAWAAIALWPIPGWSHGVAGGENEIFGEGSKLPKRRAQHVEEMCHAQIAT
jgi:hypothetical protein